MVDTELLSYTEPELEIISFDALDIIATSNDDKSEDEVPLYS